jgi:hypothetical protein
LLPDVPDFFEVLRMKTPIPLMAMAFLFLGTAHAGGGVPGMNGQLKIFPQTGYVVAVLSNFDPPAAQTIASFLDLRLGR